MQVVQRPWILVADDQEDVPLALDLLLRSEGFDVTAVDSPAGVLSTLGERRYDAALVDLNYTRDTAALLMANLIGCLRSEVARNADMARALGTVNRLFHAGTATERYATLFLASYDDHDRSLRYANCGHVPPFLLRADGRLARLAPTAPAIGLLSDWSCEVASLALGPGDLLLVASDGLTEATSASDEAFGDDRLGLALRAAPRTDAGAACDAIRAAVGRFAGPEHEDDRTLLVARGR